MTSLTEGGGGGVRKNSPQIAEIGVKIADGGGAQFLHQFPYMELGTFWECGYHPLKRKPNLCDTC